MHLRPATMSDIAALEACQDRLVDFQRPFDSTTPPSGRVAYDDLEQLISADTVYFLVAEIDSTVAGCGFGEIRADNDWSVNDTVGYIGLMFVDEQFRAQGVGRMIVRELMTWFDDHGVHDVRVKAYAANDGALAAYRSYGFEDFVIEMRAVK